MLRWYRSEEGSYLTEDDSLGELYARHGMLVDIGPAKTGTNAELHALMAELYGKEVNNIGHCQTQGQENHCRVIQFSKAQGRKVVGSGLQVRKKPDEPGSVYVTDFECPHCLLSYYSTDKNAICPACGSKPNIREDDY